MNLKKFFQEVTRESKRVRWPKSDALISSIIVVIVITVFSALALTLEDLAVAELLGQIRSAFETLR
ncbi:MAG: SecE/Sec61-gamma subunit of protein translocation complex [Bacillota bacterium]|jgi:preprotein translocase SecE subunit